MGLPRHVAIIMDGNGRWAESRGQERLYGHAKGAGIVRKITTHSRKIGIEALTLYAFSEQNWNRPKSEIDGLMELFGEYLISEQDEIMDNNIRFSVIGNRKLLSKSLQKSIMDLEKISSKNSGMDLCVAVSYGSREEILNATKKIAQLCLNGEISPEIINEELFNSSLYTANLPPLDLVIRTSGELRLSNFLLWQSAYAEFYFTNTLWPDFDENEFEEAIKSYSKRNRRFGMTSKQLKE